MKFQGFTITGLRKAVRDYNEINRGGYYRPLYGELWIDRNTGEMHTSESASRNSRVVFGDPAITILAPKEWADVAGFRLKENVVKEYAACAIREWTIPSPRTVYVVQEVSRGDIEPWCVTYDKDVATANAWGCWNHLTSGERAQTRVTVEVYRILAPGKETAIEAWNRLLLDDDDSIYNPTDVIFDTDKEANWK